eukprot:8707095-Pyramimonas_sp.AAC.1
MVRGCGPQPVAKQIAEKEAPPSSMATRGAAGQDDPGEEGGTQEGGALHAGATGGGGGKHDPSWPGRSRLQATPDL